MAIAIDDEDSQRLLRLFNTPEGANYLKEELGLEDGLISSIMLSVLRPSICRLWSMAASVAL